MCSEKVLSKNVSEKYSGILRIIIYKNLCFDTQFMVKHFHQTITGIITENPIKKFHWSSVNKWRIKWPKRVKSIRPGDGIENSQKMLFSLFQF